MLDERGVVKHVLHDERISAEPGAASPVDSLAAETHLELTFKSGTNERPLPLPETKPEPIRPVEPSEQSRTASLERRAAGVTFDSVLADLRMAALLPRAGETKWTWHDSAGLELNPQEAEPLLLRAEAELPLTGVAATYDVLVISGTAASQTALLGSLERQRSKTDHTFEILVQHVGQLRAPSPEVFASISLEYARSRDNLDRRRACGYTLGALARSAIETRPPVMTGADRPRCKGLECAPEEVLATLERDLARATDDQERVMLLRALGNGGQTSSFRAVAPHAKSVDPDTRRAVADALRNMEGDAVVDLLLGLAADSNGDVASMAFQSLFRKALDSPDWDVIEQLVQRDLVAEDACSALVNGLTSRRPETPRADPGPLRERGDHVLPRAGVMRVEGARELRDPQLAVFIENTRLGSRAAERATRGDEHA